MRLGYYDRVNGRAAQVKVFYLPRQKGEDRTAYCQRFFEEIRGLGNVALCLVNKRGHRVFARRGY